MSLHNPPRGGTAVGQLDHLGPVEAAAILCLRLCAGAQDAMDAVQMHCVQALGAEAGGRAAEAIANVLGLLRDHGRRPLAWHAPGCKCVGADEACIAQMVGAACDGDMEDAMLMAVLIVRPDVAPLLTAEAQRLGFALRRIGLRDRFGQAGRGTGGPSARLH